MVRFLATAVAVLVLSGAGMTSALAKQCRDSHGKFTKCPTTAMAAPAKKCRDAKGKFTKCPAMKK